MTDTLERPDTKETLWITDAELIRRIGVPEKIARNTIRLLDHDRRSGFPQKQAIWGDRRYWPACKAWIANSGGKLEPRKIQEPKEKAPPPIGSVYFLASDTHIKIGFTTRLKKRVGELRISQPHELRLRLLLTKVPRSLETELHRRFKKYRVPGRREWFTLSPEIDEFVHWVKFGRIDHWRKVLLP